MGDLYDKVMALWSSLQDFLSIFLGWLLAPHWMGDVEE